MSPQAVNLLQEGGEFYLDLSYYWDLLAPGGILLGDDYMWYWPGVIHDVDLFMKHRYPSTPPPPSQSQQACNKLGADTVFFFSVMNLGSQEAYEGLLMLNKEQ